MRAAAASLGGFGHPPCAALPSSPSWADTHLFRSCWSSSSGRRGGPPNGELHRPDFVLRCEIKLALWLALVGTFVNRKRRERGLKYDNSRARG